MRAVLLGNGMIAEEHRRAYRILAEEGSFVELCAVCDIRSERREEGKTDGKRAYANLDEMLENEKDIDFVDICLPTFLHAEYAIKCMEKGYNVLCEKPMALTYEDTQRMIECSKRTGKKLMIAHSCRFCHQTLETKKFIDSGKFGKVQSAFFSRAGGRPMWGWENWLNKEECSGGAMFDFQAHDADLAVWFLGQPDSVSTTAVRRIEGGGYDSVSANLVYGKDVFAHIWVDWGVPKNKFGGEYHRINFEKGYIYCAGGSFVAVDRDGKYPEWCPPEQSGVTIKTLCAEVKSADKLGAPEKV